MLLRGLEGGHGDDLLLALFHWAALPPHDQIFARAKDSKHQKRLASIMDVVAMVPTLPEDSIIVSLPFGGAVLRSLGCSTEEVNALLEETRKKFVMEKGECHASCQGACGSLGTAW